MYVCHNFTLHVAHESYYLKHIWYRVSKYQKKKSVRHLHKVLLKHFKYQTTGLSKKDLEAQTVFAEHLEAEEEESVI